MSYAIRTPTMTREEFFPWAEAQDARYEFDGLAPVPMTGGTPRHSRICQNLWFALRSRLRGTSFESLGPDAGVATVGQAVRYPDAVICDVRTPDDARIMLGVVAVFEVISPTSGRTDRIEKLREYRAVPSIRRYVIVEHASVALTVFERAEGGQNWTATALTADDTLDMPEIGIAVPVLEFYEEVDLPTDSGSVAE